MRYELLAPLLAATSAQGARRVMTRCLDYEEGRLAFKLGGAPFVADPPEAKALAAAMAAHPGLSAQEAEAAAREVAREASEKKRRAYEARMVKRARAEGLPDDHHIKAGLQAPAREQIMRLRDLAREEQLVEWKLHFGRHCREFHMEGNCPWELDPRGCGFLHPGDDAGTASEQCQRAEEMACAAEQRGACG
eukprot:6591945-Prymnesium_polylepis.1